MRKARPGAVTHACGEIFTKGMNSSVMPWHSPAAKSKTG
jgi:hypothetical protein